MARLFNESFWGRVEQRLFDHGLSMRDLSRMTDIPYSTLFNQKTQGTVPPKREQVEKMAGVLGCSPNYLLTGAEREQNTLSPDLMELISHFKILTDGQKETVRQLIDQFTRDNQKYAEIYLELHPVEK